MKKLTILILLFPMIFFSQEEFSFELYFEDALGNKDTLILGYDPLATDSIDVAFGEVNIVNQPWDSVFEVRCSDISYFQESPTFQTKKDIRPFGTFICIEVLAINYPITMNWDSTLFNNNELMGSGFELPHILHYFGYFYNQSDHQIYEEDMDFSITGGITGLLDSGIICVSIQDSSVIGLNTDKLEKTESTIFPNPSSSVLNVEVSEEFLGGELKIFDILGNQVWIETIKSNRFTIDNFANLSEGVYTILLSKDGYFETQKVVKQ